MKHTKYKNILYKPFEMSKVVFEWPRSFSIADSNLHSIQNFIDFLTTKISKILCYSREIKHLELILPYTKLFKVSHNGFFFFNESFYHNLPLGNFIINTLDFFQDVRFLIVSSNSAICCITSYKNSNIIWSFIKTFKNSISFQWTYFLASFSWLLLLSACFDQFSAFSDDCSNL